MKLSIRPESSVAARAAPAAGGAHVISSVQWGVDSGRNHTGRVSWVMSLVAVGLLGFGPGCSLQDFSDLERGGTITAAAGGTAASGTGGSSSSGMGTGGMAAVATGGSTSPAIEPDPDLPVLNCGATACSDSAMIADMEANDGQVCTVDGRAGAVSFFGDGTGSQWPPVGVASKFSPLEACRGLSAVALHFKGVNFTSWGAGLTVEFSKTGWNASAYTGLLVWARSSTSTQISVGVVTRATQDVAYGGTCVPTGGKQCTDYFAAKRTLTPNWTAYPILFAELRQGGWGVPAPTTSIDASALMSLNIVAPQGQPFDFWLDDITFSL